MLFSPVQVRSCDITLVKCVRQLLPLSRAYLCIIYIKRQKANFLSRKRLLHSENLVQPLFSVKTFSFSNSSAALVVYIINAALVCLKRIRIRFCFLLLTKCLVTFLPTCYRASSKKISHSHQILH